MIRTYQNEDLPQLLELISRNIPKYFDASEKKDYQDYLTSKREDYFVFEKDEHIIGAAGINYFPTEKTARLSWDMIDPAFQGQGIGKQLVFYRLNHIQKATDYRQVIVRTSQLAEKFYAKFGFQTERVEKDYWAKGFDLFL
ncbi:MAG: GNAT family N-acetyltransferase, partial [Saprospiraceae bacterium]